MDEEIVWKILDTYHSENSCAHIQLNSFNHFVTFGMQDIIDQNSTLIVGKNYKVKFGQIWIAPPHIIEEDRSLKIAYPSDARSRDLNYDSAIHCDITEIFGDEKKEHNRVVIGRIPIMLKSSICNLSIMTDKEQQLYGECPNDPGGYFIIKGNERVLTSQLRAAYSKVFVLKQKPDSKYKYIAEIRSRSVETTHSILVQAMIGADDRTLMFSLPYINTHIPIGIVFRALGFNDIEIKGFIGFQSHKYITYILRDCQICQTQKEALQYIGKYAMHTINKDSEEKYAFQVIETELFPHLGISGSLKQQACFLGHMVRKLLMTSLGMRYVDDRDNCACKRVDDAGALMYEIFSNMFKKYISTIQAKLEKRKNRPDIMSIISRDNSITKGFHQCFSTGNWTVQKNDNFVRTGVAQILDRMTFGSSLSHRRRILIPMGNDGKNTEIRQVHSSQFGFVCPSETPEGHKVGIVLNFALSASVSRHISPVVVKNVLESNVEMVSIEDISIEDIGNFTCIYLDNVPIGYTENAEETVKTIRELRKNHILDREISVSYDSIDDEILIFCDEGRFIRPLFVLKDNKVDIENLIKYQNSWSDLIYHDVIRYVDAEEIQSSVIAMNPGMLSQQHSDFMEIHPSLMFGVMASIIPFPDHSQSPRNCYQASMGKQAIGLPVLSYNLRTDTLLQVLHYPQKPIVSTRASRSLGFSEMPSGINAIVAIACYTGYNQEDSVILNYSAIQRGLFSLTSYRTLEDFEKKRETYSHEKIRMPPKDTRNLKKDDPDYFRRKNANYSLLDENGIIRSRIPYKRRCVNKDCHIDWFNGMMKKCPECNTKSSIVKGGGSVPVKKGDVIIGKVLVTGNKLGEETITDISKVVQEGEEGFIDSVYTRITPDGYRLVKVVIRKNRVPELGDKLASRAAQKGTIGMVMHEKDMPFTANGCIPDIIINPLCIPSRMTVNQLIECALGKYCCITGEYGDATPFTENSINIADKFIAKADSTMRNLGFDPHGWEEMYNGKTGEKLHAKIFIGPTYYQRLKHMVADKLHARDEGQVTMLTRQPLEGRSRDGGLRFGEMERDCIISHGATAVLQERLFKVSDPFQIIVCNNCGVMTSSTKQCQSCMGDKLSKVNFPYASKLLLQELMTMGIKVLVNPKK